MYVIHCTVLLRDQPVPGFQSVQTSKKSRQEGKNKQQKMMEREMGRACKHLLEYLSLPTTVYLGHFQKKTFYTGSTSLSFFNSLAAFLQLFSTCFVRLTLYCLSDNLAGEFLVVHQQPFRAFFWMAQTRKSQTYLDITLHSTYFCKSHLSTLIYKVQ